MQETWVESRGAGGRQAPPPGALREGTEEDHFIAKILPQYPKNTFEILINHFKS